MAGYVMKVLVWALLGPSVIMCDAYKSIELTVQVSDVVPKHLCKTNIQNLQVCCQFCSTVHNSNM